MGEERIDELAAGLEHLCEQLGDAAMDLLRAGLAEGTEAASARAAKQERLVNRARAAVEKAVHLLGQASALPLEGGVADEGHDADEPKARPRRPRAAEPTPWETP